MFHKTSINHNNNQLFDKSFEVLLASKTKCYLSLRICCCSQFFPQLNVTNMKTADSPLLYPMVSCIEFICDAFVSMSQLWDWFESRVCTVDVSLVSTYLMRTLYTAEHARLQNPELKVNLYSRQRLVSTLTIKTAAALAEALGRIGAFFQSKQDEAPSSYCHHFFCGILSW